MPICQNMMNGSIALIYVKISMVFVHVLGIIKESVLSYLMANGAVIGKMHIIISLGALTIGLSGHLIHTLNNK